MKIGNQDITSIYVGNEQICTIYIGNEQVYNGCSSPTHDYSQDYLTLDIVSGGTVKLANDVFFSTDSGSTWTEATVSTNTFNASTGDKVLLKGTTGSLGNIVITSSTIYFDVEGNIMSLLYGDNFSGQTSMGNNNFANAFTSTNVISAENLILPATALTQNCYAEMFEGCTSLVTAPSVLSATTLAQDCYYSMFDGCTSLTTPPSQIGNSSTTLADCCYRMFADCTSLTTAPELPATTLADWCYNNMFINCTSLTTAPELPATTLGVGCYRQMFHGCTSLTVAPVLSATTLTNYCYSEMFRGCSNLNSITCYATDISATNCTNNWVTSVASSGDFSGYSSANWQCGDSGIPSGWSVNPLDGGIWDSPCGGIGLGDDEPIVDPD